MKLQKTEIIITLEERKITPEEYESLKKLFPDDRVTGIEHWTNKAIRPKARR